MHPSVMGYVIDTLDTLDMGSVHAVLEVGSYDENGSVRRLFGDCSYMGVDERPGPGVDRVASGNLLPFPDCTFDVVVSTEALEHDRFPWRTVAEMTRVAHPGGTVIVTCRGFDERGCYGWHPSPEDYWRFSVKGLAEMADADGLEVLDVRSDPTDPGVFLCARKP